MTTGERAATEVPRGTVAGPCEGSVPRLVDLHLDFACVRGREFGERDLQYTVLHPGRHVLLVDFGWEANRAVDRLGLRAVGVDVIRADDGWFAVDLNPCPSFHGTGLTDALVASIEACLD